MQIIVVQCGSKLSRLLPPLGTDGTAWDLEKSYKNAPSENAAHRAYPTCGRGLFRRPTCMPDANHRCTMWLEAFPTPSPTGNRRDSMGLRKILQKRAERKRCTSGIPHMWSWPIPSSNMHAGCKSSLYNVARSFPDSFPHWEQTGQHGT